MAFVSLCKTPRSVSRPSERWASPEEMAPLSSGSPLSDMALAAGVGLSIAPRPEFEDQRNGNVAVIGGSGSGKTRLLLYNLASHPENVNFILTDTKEELEKATRAGFEADGYDVVRLDAVDPSQGDRYDPLLYVADETDVRTVARMISESVTPDRASVLGGDRPFWNACEDLLLESLIGALLAIDEIQGPDAPRACTFPNLLKLFSLAKGFEDEKLASALDLFFNALSSGRVFERLTGEVLHEFDPTPASSALSKYKGLKTAAARTYKSIVVSLQSSLGPFQGEAARRFVSGDDLRLHELDRGKRVVYLRMSDTNSGYAFLGRLVTRSIAHFAVREADSRPSGRLDRSLFLLLDELANLGAMDGLEKTASVARSRGIALHLFLQSVGQLRQVYGRERAQAILDCCDSLVFLGGGSGPDTPEYVSRICGEHLVAHRTVGRERAEVEVSAPVSSASEISRMPRTECIVKVSGKRPWRGPKTNIESHPNYGRFIELER